MAYIALCPLLRRVRDAFGQMIRTSDVISTGNLRLARIVAPRGESENELLFIIAAQSILAPYALIWPALLKQPAGEILSPRGQPNLS